MKNQTYTDFCTIAQLIRNSQDIHINPHLEQDDEYYYIVVITNTRERKTLFSGYAEGMKFGFETYEAALIFGIAWVIRQYLDDANFADLLTQAKEI